MNPAEREEMEFDVVIVGAGPAGLTAACRLMQQAAAAGRELSVCVLEKGAEVGSHILSGALLDTSVLEQLFSPDQLKQAPLGLPVSREQTWWLADDRRRLTVPSQAVPETLHNAGTRIISLGRLCRWLAEQAENAGADIFTGFCASELVYENGRVAGVITGDMGLNADATPGPEYEPGILIRAQQVMVCEGSRGHLGQDLNRHFSLNENTDPQHYALGFKELWKVSDDRYQPGLAIHGSGWPLGSNGGGFYIYHGEEGRVQLGLIVDLNYRNPWLNPYQEFQKLKQHPALAALLQQGERIGYGARSLTKGGFNALGKMSFPGGFLLGCDAGTLDPSRMKGIDTAMLSGLLAADAWLAAGDDEDLKQQQFERRWQASDICRRLQQTRSFAPALHRLGTLAGAAFNRLNQSLGYRLPAVQDSSEDALQLKPAAAETAPDYPSADGRLSFSISDSVYLASTVHDESQPCHLQVLDPSVWKNTVLRTYAGPAQRYCPAGVYELSGDAGAERLQINAANCLHCKTCDIKDPCANIRWTPPQGGSGPNYVNM